MSRHWAGLGGSAAHSAFDFGDGFADAIKMGVDFQSPAVGPAGVGHLAQMEEAVTHAGPGTEVAWHQADGLSAVGDGIFVAILQEADDGSLVERFGEGGVEL